MADSPQQKLRLKDRRRRLMWIKVAAGSTVVALSLVLVWFVARLPSVTISSVEVKGTSLVSAEALKGAAEEKLSGSYAYLIPRKNSLVFPERDIKETLAVLFPPLSKITISRNGFTGLTLTVEERVAVASWCSGVPQEVNADSEVSDVSCYSIDKTGFIFAPAGAESTIRFYGALSENPIGKTYLDGGFASLHALVADISSSINRVPDTVVVDGASSDVAVTFQGGEVLKFVRSSNQQATLANIASVFASQSFKSGTEFEYADFRFGDKVYVKFKGE